LKINIFDLEFNCEYFYIHSKSIVEKINFNNRIFYSKYRKIKQPLSSLLIKQHQDNDITLALPLIENNCVNYFVIEYENEDWKSFYSLIQYLLKSLHINEYSAYQNNKKNLLQIFIKRKNTAITTAYQEIENLQHLIELKSNKSYKLFPNKNLPKNYNIITFPQQKL